MNIFSKPQTQKLCYFLGYGCGAHKNTNGHEIYSLPLHNEKGKLEGIILPQFLVNKWNNEYFF
jgi:hypothetical protein